MSDVVIIGNVVEENNDKKEIAWQITDFFAVAENKKEIQSPQFSFADVSWHLRIFLKSTEKIGFMNLVLMKVGDLNCSVEYNFGLKTLNSGVEHLKKAVFEKIVRGEYEGSESFFLKLSEIKEKKSVLSDVFTILCTLKREALPSDILKLTSKQADIKQNKIQSIFLCSVLYQTAAAQTFISSSSRLQFQDYLKPI